MFTNLVTKISQNKITAGLIIGIIIAILAGLIIHQQFIASQSTPVDEVNLTFNAEGPYALLSPRRDGNALILNLKRTKSYDSISYELSYASEVSEVAVKNNLTTDEGSSDDSGSIDRGVVGSIETKDKKGEYTQEILFGTCSKQICKYDKGIENGTLTLHIRKGGSAFRMITQWHLQRPDVALGNLTSGDEHFNFNTTASRQDLNSVGFVIINDLTGVPKLPDGKTVLGKVYAFNPPIAKSFPDGMVTIESAENLPDGAKIARFDEGQNKWIEYDTKIEGSTLSASADGAGIFAVLVNKK